MDAATALPRFQILNCLNDTGRDDLIRDAREGLTAPQKTLPSKYFYDARGSRLFERITRLPEYYQTRTELSILRRNAGDIVRNCRDSDLIELGPGTNRKVRVLLDAARAARKRIRYVPVDVCEPALRGMAEELLKIYPELDVYGIVADFTRHMDMVPDGDGRLVAFFGGTIGNFDDEETGAFLRQVARAMGPEDRFLVGIDMVKPKPVLEAAYNDAQGITAAFNRNILNVINRRLDARFEPSRFDHVAYFNEDRERIEMHLRASRNLSVKVPRLGLTVKLARGETIFTEISRKYREESVRKSADDAGLSITRWFSDPRRWFSLVELAPANPRPRPAHRSFMGRAAGDGAREGA